MTKYKIRYALHDQAYDVGSGYFWTWKDESLSKESLVEFYRSISDCIPTNLNAIKSGEVHFGHKVFQGQHVVYRFYDGAKDRSGRPNRCVILTAWLEATAGQAGEPPNLSDSDIDKILRLPTFKQLEDIDFAQRIPISAPWFLSEQFPTEGEIWKANYSSLRQKYEKKKQSEETLNRKIEELQRKNEEQILSLEQVQVGTMVHPHLQSSYKNDIRFSDAELDLIMQDMPVSSSAQTQTFPHKTPTAQKQRAIINSGRSHSDENRWFCVECGVGIFLLGFLFGCISSLLIVRDQITKKPTSPIIVVEPPQVAPGPPNSSVKSKQPATPKQPVKQSPDATRSSSNTVSIPSQGDVVKSSPPQKKNHTSDAIDIQSHHEGPTLPSLP